MKSRLKFAAIMLLILTGSGSIAGATENQKDEKALDVLNRMAAYTGSMNQLIIKGEIFADARLDAGLLVSNPSEITIKIDRPGSLYIEKFDGLHTKKIYIHNGKLTVFNSERNFYARAEVPDNIQDAMQYAMEEFDLETPLGELFFADSAVALITEQDTLMYLTDKSRIGGVDCHHIAVRGAEIDLQLWVEEGDSPAPRKMTMTMKWEGGSPRQTALMEWTSTSDLDPKVFDFEAPEGAQEIRFVGSE
jgi:hypothetical protein